MQMHITGRHVEITDDVRSYVEKRVKKIEAFFNRIIDLQLVIELEKTRYFTEIVLATAKATFHAQGETHDIFSCLDTVMDKIERQIRRHKERTKDWRHRTPLDHAVVQLNDTATREDINASPSVHSQIFRVPDKFASKPMTVEEAVMQLHTSDEQLLLFLNAETNQINVVYEQENRGYGWVEPQFT
jgi:putative sigma-54 modulation protein